MDIHEELAQALAHVALGERLIERQRQVIARLAGCGGDVGLANELLATLEHTQASLCDHRELIRRELDEEAPRRAQPEEDSNLRPSV